MSPKRRKPGPVTSASDSLEGGKKLDTGAFLARKKFKSLDDPRTQSLAKTVQEGRLSAGASVADFPYNKKRVRLMSPAPDLKEGARGIMYWMSRDQRVQDNWAFLYAQRLALKQGLEEVAEECRLLAIPFHLLVGFAKDTLPIFVTQHGIGGVVTDFSPLRVPMQWVQDVQERLPSDVPLAQVDAHNIVPCWVASDKQEYGARTIRRKIHDRLAEFLTEFPPVWQNLGMDLQVDRSVKEVEWATPGSASGLKVLEEFVKDRLKCFGSDRNDPNRPALSNLSPWFHFGQVAVQRAILEVRKHRTRYKESVEGFVEEAVVRRELADNFCFYNPNYDKVEGAYDWAKTTLKLHAQDKRPYLYTLEQLEEGKTHDPLWNAAQLQMVHEGKMHGFLRMYWAKKILEWTRSPEEALQFSIYLNDRYELDGRDPNGYVGCMWSICGIHDQGWAERAIFGKIRYMNYAGCKRKFDVAQFERKYRPQRFTQ
uniref:Deoxyribodipyrimidine photo-lyase n=1 Tax=Naja naja TaxID=35670 RepID=A0A8C6X9W6_NAJNA